MMARHRAVVTTIANLAVITLAYASAFLLRFDLTMPHPFAGMFLVTLPVAIAIQYAAFYGFKLTRGWWRYVGVVDFLNAVKAAFVGALGLGTYVILFYRHGGYPRSVLLLNAGLIVGISVGMRLVVRLWRQMPADRDGGKRKRLIIVGAGDTGEALLREIRQQSHAQ